MTEKGALEQLVDELAAAIAPRVAELVAEALKQPSDGYMSVSDAASVIGCERQRIYDLLSQGRLTRFKDGSRTLISRAELEAHVRGEPVGPVADALPSRRRSGSGRAAAA